MGRRLSLRVWFLDVIVLSNLVLDVIVLSDLVLDVIVLSNLGLGFMSSLTSNKS